MVKKPASATKVVVAPATRTRALSLVFVEPLLTVLNINMWSLADVPEALETIRGSLKSPGNESALNQAATVNPVPLTSKLPRSTKSSDSNSSDLIDESPDSVT